MSIRPFQEIYHEMSADLATAEVSLDDEANAVRIVRFREKFRKLLDDRVDVVELRKLMKNAEEGRWDVLPRDVYNAFYCCIAACRHAYRYVSSPSKTTLSDTF